MRKIPPWYPSVWPSARHWPARAGLSTSLSKLDTKDNEKVTASKARKKVSPSTQRRNQRRRNEFLASKEAPSPLKTSLNYKIHDGEAVLESKFADCIEVEKLFVSCDFCGHSTKTQNGIKLHKKNKHEILQIDGNNSINEEQKDADSGNVKKTMVSCEICGHTTNTKNEMKLNMKRKH